MKQEKTYGIFGTPNRGNPVCSFFFALFSKKTHLDESLKKPMSSTCSVCFDTFTFTGKEKDSETGYYAFGARYYDPTLSGLFLSVDPMSDKYPSISPYAYCAWNPVKLVDPDGEDTINVNLDKGSIERIKSDGDHSVCYYRNEELIFSEPIKKEKCSFRTNSYDLLYSDSDKKSECHNEHLLCSDIETGENIFKNIASLGSSVEWDYYSLKNNGGDLSSSGIKDNIIHKDGEYTAKTVTFWNHYHPAYTSDSFFPSHNDQDHARDLKGAKCTIFSGGLSMEFNNYVPSQKNRYISLSEFRQLWNRYAK